MGASRAETGPCRDCPGPGAQLCRLIRNGARLAPPPPVPRRFERGRVILAQGEAGGFLGVIRRGHARRAVTRINGARTLLGLALPGDIVYASPGQRDSHEVEAASDLEICIHDRATVQRHLEADQPFRERLLQEMDRQHRRVLDLLWRNGTLNSRERIIAFLLRATELIPCAALPDGSLVLNMPIGRTDWADLTNTAPETISRTLRRLEESGDLTSLTPHRFRIHDPRALAERVGIDLPARTARPADRPGRGADNKGANNKGANNPRAKNRKIRVPLTMVNDPVPAAPRLRM